MGEVMGRGRVIGRTEMEGWEKLMGRTGMERMMGEKVE